MTAPTTTYLGGPPRAGHLFDGIHGFGLGLRGITAPEWTCEAAEFPRSVLHARLPGIDHYEDVRDVAHLRPGEVDLLTGGFPCQDLSVAGSGAGIGGARSGLWAEYARIIGQAQPAAAIIENVPALLWRGMDRVLADLAALGYSAEWDCIPAAAVGAPHLRDRVWIVAHRQAAPIVFGDPAALFPRPPEPSAGRWAGEWHRWSRAGWHHCAEPGVAVPLLPLAPRPARRDGTLPLLPTPAARDWKDTGAGRMGRRQLPAALAAGRWPTPKASASGPDYARARRARSGTDDLATAVARTAQGPLNPEWVEWLMGFPLGWTDPDACPEAEARPWVDEPAGVPRTLSAGQPRPRHANARLRALGNALVPQVAGWIGGRLQGCGILPSILTI